MWTQEYKGHYIRGYMSVPECIITGWGHPLAGRVYKSLHAAKIAITKHIKENA